jgi:hypothetical protein
VVDLDVSVNLGRRELLLVADFVAKVGAEQLAGENAQQSNREKWDF